MGYSWVVWLAVKMVASKAWKMVVAKVGLTAILKADSSDEMTVDSRVEKKELMLVGSKVFSWVERLVDYSAESRAVATVLWMVES